MYKREGFVKNFITIEGQNVYLSLKTQNVRIAVIHGRNISFGNKSLVQEGDTVILMYKRRCDLLVSISRYEGDFTFIEECSKISKVDETNPTFPRLRDVYPDMENLATLYKNYYELYMQQKQELLQLLFYFVDIFIILCYY